MHNEGVFRAICILITVAVIVIMAYHRIKAATGEKLHRCEEGLAILLLTRLGGLSCWVVVIAYMVSPDWMAWSRVEPRR